MSRYDDGIRERHPIDPIEVREKLARLLPRGVRRAAALGEDLRRLFSVSMMLIISRGTVLTMTATYRDGSRKTVKAGTLEQVLAAALAACPAKLLAEAEGEEFVNTASARGDSGEVAQASRIGAYNSTGF